jgi:adenylate cyclase
VAFCFNFANIKTITLMAKEIERKFLVVDDSYKQMARSSVEIAQGYLSVDPRATVRVRLKGNRAYLTVKGINIGATRSEWEYEVPIADAREMLSQCCSKVITKRRYLVDYGGFTWEVDDFQGPLAPLVVAEVEIPDEHTAVSLPAFIGQEVTGDARYYNSSLAASLPDSISD